MDTQWYETMKKRLGEKFVMRQIENELEKWNVEKMNEVRSFFPPTLDSTFLIVGGGASNGTPLLISFGQVSDHYGLMALQSPTILSSANPAGYHQLSWPENLLRQALPWRSGWHTRRSSWPCSPTKKSRETCLSYFNMFNWHLHNCFANSNSIFAQGPGRLVEGWTCSPVERCTGQPSTCPQAPLWGWCTLVPSFICLRLSVVGHTSDTPKEKAPKQAQNMQVLIYHRQGVRNLIQTFFSLLYLTRPKHEYGWQIFWWQERLVVREARRNKERCTCKV